MHASLAIRRFRCSPDVERRTSIGDVLDAALRKLDNAEHPAQVFTAALSLKAFRAVKAEPVEKTEHSKQ